MQVRGARHAAKDTWAEAWITWHMASSLDQAGRSSEAEKYASKAVQLSMETFPVPGDDYDRINTIVNGYVQILSGEKKFADAEAVLKNAVHFYDEREYVPAWNSRVSFLLDRYAELLKDIPVRAKDAQDIQLRSKKRLHLLGPFPGVA